MTRAADDDARPQWAKLTTARATGAHTDDDETQAHPEALITAPREGVDKNGGADHSASCLMSQGPEALITAPREGPKDLMNKVV